MMWLSPRLWMMAALAAALIGSHWYVFTAGKSSVQAKWDKDIAERAQIALAAEQAARQKEQSLVAQKDQLERRYVDQKRKSEAAAARANAELSRLRDEIRAAASRPASKDPAPASRADGTNAFPELLGECAGALLELGQEADRLKGIAGGLQDYAKNVCRN